MNILLLYPEFPTTFWSFKHALKFLHKRSLLPPLGLLTVAAMLPRQWKLRLVDLNVRSLSEQDVAWADLVFISAMLAQRSSAKQLVSRCRAAGKTIVAGGPLFTSAQGEFSDVNHLVLNEAELTLPEFLRDFSAGNPRHVYASSAFANIRESPIPLWALVDVHSYGSMALQFSRGCPFDCEFCDVTARFGHVPRSKSAAQVVSELSSIQQTGWRGNVFFVDDNFIGNKRALKKELLPALISWQRAQRSGFPFFTEASINLADDVELMSQMTEAGFDSVFIGIETPDADALAECNKRQNQGRDLIADVKRIQRAGLQVQGGFILGFDSDQPSIFQRQIEFIQKSGIVTAMVGLLNALPGTKLYARLKREGRLSGISSGDNVDGTLNFITRMPWEQLREGYRDVLRGIYTPRPYYQRIRTFLREYRRPRVSTPLSWRHGVAAIWSSVRLGLVGNERLEYWRLMAWTLFYRPASLPLAITLAIYGHHFRKCSIVVVG
jgi:radical SAM superfamily enzyme YgiQ (UPF0313 family)